MRFFVTDQWRQAAQATVAYSLQAAITQAAHGCPPTGTGST